MKNSIIDYLPIIYSIPVENWSTLIFIIGEYIKTL